MSTLLAFTGQDYYSDMAAIPIRTRQICLKSLSVLQSCFKLYIYRPMASSLNIRNFFEQSAFGVCAYVGHHIGMAVPKVRLYFIYLSFVTLGSSLLLYLIIWFWMSIRRALRQRALPFKE